MQKRGLDRRAFLRAGAAVLGGIGAVTALSACGGSTGAGGPAPGPGPAQQGGTLRAGFVGGGATETLNHLTGPTALDYVRARARHGALGTVDPTAPDGVRYDLLAGIDVSADLREYTLRLRPGLRFTDGSPVTGRDVVSSLAAPATLGSLPYLKNVVSAFDLPGARVPDELTVVLPARTPLVDGRLLICQSNLVFREGTREFTADMPTCGPFRLTGFEPGRGASFVRHDGYTAPPGEQGPYLEGLELLSIADSAARSAALTGGQLDYADNLAPVAARTLEGRDGVAVTATEPPFVNQLSFSMNLRQAPFGDPRVREAVMLAVDRRRIVDTVFFGRAAVGNDLPGLGFPGYAAELPQRVADPDRARGLLAAAGAAGAPVTLTTGPETPGMVESATLVVEDLRAIGLDARLAELPAGQLYADFAAYGALAFAGGYNPPQPVLTSFLSTRVAGAPTTFGFDRPDIDALARAGRSDPDPARRASALAEAQRRTWAEGNTLIPIFAAAANAAVPTVQGVNYTPFADFRAAAVR